MPGESTSGNRHVSKRTITLLVIVIALGAIFFFFGPEIRNVIDAALVVGPIDRADDHGVVRREPQLILNDVNQALRDAGQDEIDLNELALARAIQSEQGNSAYETRVWVAWTILNNAGSPDRLFSKLTDSNDSGSSGLFASQIADHRYAATQQAASAENIRIAILVARAQPTDDITGGATNFFSPRLQDKLWAKALAGDPKYVNRIKGDADYIRARWEKGGLASLGTPNSGDDIEFFG